MNTEKLTINGLESALRSHSGDAQREGGAGRPAPSSSAPAAVTVLFNTYNDEASVLMIKRASTLSHHSGEWAFPGGLIEESDASPLAAALRETNEELGVDAKDIEVWCGMDSVDTSTGFEVWPYAGRIGDDVALAPYEGEVADVVNVPVRVFTDESSRRTITVIRNGSTRKLVAYAYEDRIIWGASARIIANTIEIAIKAA